MTNLSNFAYHIRREAPHVRTVVRERAYTARVLRKLEEAETLPLHAAEDLERYTEIKRTAFRPVYDVKGEDLEEAE